MSAFAAIAMLVAGLALVIAGAELFFKSVLATAARLGVSPFVITVVLSGFELENLAAGIAANLKGLPGAAAGTFLGGTTFLALGVAGLSGMIAPIESRLPPAVLLWTAAAPLPLAALSADGELSRLDGGLLVAWFLVALIGVARSGRRLLSDDGERHGRAFLVRLAAGIALLAAGGEILGEGIRSAVSRLGVSQTLLGNTVIAASVEAEEVARVAVPSRRGRGDVALANVAGTIVHFVAFNAGVIALVRPLPLDHASTVLHLPVAIGSVLILCGLLAVLHRVGRASALALLCLYGAYLIAAITATG